MKRIVTMSLALVVLATMFGVIGLAETKSDYDHNYRLTPGKTWNFRTQKSSANDSLGNNSFWDRRVRDDLSKQFAATGLTRASNAAPDLMISYHLGARQSYETEYLNTGFPTY